VRRFSTQYERIIAKYDAHALEWILRARKAAGTSTNMSEIQFMICSNMINFSYKLLEE
jgi:hypothetical protein